MCAKNHPRPTFLTVKGLARQKVVKRKSTNFTRCPKFFAPSDRIASQRKLKELKLCMYLINYFHNVCAKNHPRPTSLRVKGLATKEVFKRKSTIVTRCSTYSASNDKTSSQVELKKFKLCKYLIKYFHNVCQKSSKPMFLTVKGLARQKVVKPKSTKFTSCSTYSTSIQKILSQGNCSKLRLCIYFS